MRPQKVIFFHLPKTAGTSLREVFDANYSKKDLAFCYKFKEGSGQIESKMQSALQAGRPIIYGHIDFRQLENTKNWADYQLLTCLRHPVPRVVSHYVFLLNSRQDAKRKEVEEMKNFEGFLKSYYGQNWQSQILAGLKKDPISLDEPTFLMEKALNNLSKFSWIGITERYDETLLSLKEFLGLNKIWISKQNTTRNQELKENLMREFEAEIIERNKADLEMYKFGETQLDKQLEAVENLKMEKLKLRALSLFK